MSLSVKPAKLGPRAACILMFLEFDEYYYYQIFFNGPRATWVSVSNQLNVARGPHVF